MANADILDIDMTVSWDTPHDDIFAILMLVRPDWNTCDIAIEVCMESDFLPFTVCNQTTFE